MKVILRVIKWYNICCCGRACESFILPDFDHLCVALGFADMEKSRYFDSLQMSVSPFCLKNTVCKRRRIIDKIYGGSGLGRDFTFFIVYTGNVPKIFFTFKKKLPVNMRKSNLKCPLAKKFLRSYVCLCPNGKSMANNLWKGNAKCGETFFVY